MKALYNASFGPVNVKVCNDFNGEGILSRGTKAGSHDLSSTVGSKMEEL
jgi:hypothetical protein